MIGTPVAVAAVAVIAGFRQKHDTVSAARTELLHTEIRRSAFAVRPAALAEDARAAGAAPLLTACSISRTGLADAATAERSAALRSASAPLPDRLVTAIAAPVRVDQVPVIARFGLLHDAVPARGAGTREAESSRPALSIMTAAGARTREAEITPAFAVLPTWLPERQTAAIVARVGVALVRIIANLRRRHDAVPTLCACSEEAQALVAALHILCARGADSSTAEIRRATEIVLT